MSEYNGGCPEFMSISLFNRFTLFPSLRLLKLQSVALQKDLSFKTLTDYVKENRELATLQLKNCKIIHEEFIEELCLSTLGSCKHLKTFDIQQVEFESIGIRKQTMLLITD